MQSRWQERQRPLTPELAWANSRCSEVVACDGSTLDALLRKIGLLEESETTPLAGQMLALLDLCSHLPRRLWYEADAEAHDQRFWPQILPALRAKSLLIFDLGFTNFQVFAQLTQAEVTFITRAKSNLAYRVEGVLSRSGLLLVRCPKRRRNAACGHLDSLCCPGRSHRRHCGNPPQSLFCPFDLGCHLSLHRLLGKSRTSSGLIRGNLSFSCQSVSLFSHSSL